MENFSYRNGFALGIILALVFVNCRAQNTPQDYVAAHNVQRSATKVALAVWNNTVAAYAQAYAKKRAVDCQLVHSDGEDYGENLAVGYGYSDGFTASDAVKLWIAEKPYYDYASNSCINGQECLHYTQVVWRDSVQLGCARVACPNGWVFHTCNYYPPGNYIDERPY